MAKKNKSEKPIYGNKLNYSDFNYHDALRFNLPAIALGIKVPDYAFNDSEYGYKEYDFKRDRKWLKIAHQTSGLACNQQYIIATLLEPKSVDVFKNIIKLQDSWYGSNTGCFGLSLEEANDYNNQLKEFFNAGCNFSWKDLQEGFYPVDTEYIKNIASDNLPSNLDDLINWRDGFERGIGCIGRWNLWILTENSD